MPRRARGRRSDRPCRITWPVNIWICLKNNWRLGFQSSIKFTNKSNKLTLKPSRTIVLLGIRKEQVPKGMIPRYGLCNCPFDALFDSIYADDCRKGFGLIDHYSFIEIFFLSFIFSLIVEGGTFSKIGLCAVVVAAWLICRVQLREVAGEEAWTDLLINTLNIRLQKPSPQRKVIV